MEKTIPLRYNYRLYPNREQRVLLARTFGCVRFVYNECLSQYTKAYEAFRKSPPGLKHRPRPNSTTFNTILNALKQEHEWLREVSSVTLQQSFRDLITAFNGFFTNRTRHPRFKSKGHTQSCRFMRTAFRVKGDTFTIAKCDTPLKVKWSRPLPNPPSSATITLNRAGQYHVSFVVEVPVQPTFGTGYVGLDLGLTHFATLSTGEKIENPRYYTRSQKRLARLQRRLSKAKKGSQNRAKLRLKIAKLHRKVANQRHDWHHKLSNRLVRENQAIGIESLRVKNMLANRKLAKHISDVGWGAFAGMLKYKAHRSVTATVLVHRSFYASTQICSECDYRLTKEQKLTLKDREWSCPECHARHDRDVNAARNLIKYTREWFTKERSLKESVLNHSRVIEVNTIKQLLV